MLKGVARRLHASECVSFKSWKSSENQLMFCEKPKCLESDVLNADFLIN